MVTLDGNPDLLAGFRRGDRAALSVVYRAYVQDVARVIRRGVRVDVDGQPVRLGANPAEADVEVLLQDTFAGGPEPTVHFFFGVDEGAHVASLTAARASSSLCVDFSIDAPAAPDRVVTSVSLSDATACVPDDPDPPPNEDERELVSIEEIIVAACGAPACTTRTGVTGAGVVTVQQGAAPPESAVANTGSRDELVSAALSTEADALFSGDDPTCPREGGAAPETITLERTTLIGSVATTESIDATGCEGGAAGQLRALMATMRGEVGGP